MSGTTGTPVNETGNHGEYQAMRDLADGLIESADGLPLGRADDLLFVRDDDGTYRCVALLLGPEALAGRVWNPIRTFLHAVLKGRFEHRIDLGEIEAFGPTLKLRHDASHYQTGTTDQWIVDHLLRFIPGNGRKS